MSNTAAKERERLTTPPGPSRRLVNGFAKRHYTERERAALAAMPIPFMLTLTAKRRMTTPEWLELVLATLSPLGHELQVDCFRQERDRSVHVAIYGLPHGAEASVITSLWKLCRQVGGRVGKRKTKSGKRAARFVVPGLSMAYAWAHDEVTSGKTSPPATVPA
jgi:hypothetical protein